MVLTHDARKSTPAGLGSCKKLRECKSVANTVCMKQECHISSRCQTKDKQKLEIHQQIEHIHICTIMEIVILKPKRLFRF